MFVGVVGEQQNRDRAIGMLNDLGIEAAIVAEVVPPAWEQETLDALAAFARTHEGIVFYAHTKGATSHNEPINTYWRNRMTWHCIEDWRTPVARIAAGARAAGCHYIPGLENQPRYFGGNFWVADLATVRTLPVCERGSRWDAELWIGYGVTPETAAELTTQAIGDFFARP